MEAVTLLSSFGRLSQRMITGALKDLLQQTVTSGQINRLQCVGRCVLQAGHNHIVPDVRSSATLNIDESGWRQTGQKAWPWTVVGVWPRCLRFAHRVLAMK